MRYDGLRNSKTAFRLLLAIASGWSVVAARVAADEAVEPSPAVVELGAMWRSGSLEAFVQAAKVEGAAQPGDAQLACWRIEALLSLGENIAAEQAAMLALRASIVEIKASEQTGAQQTGAQQTGAQQTGAEQSDVAQGDEPARLRAADSRQRLLKLWYVARLRRSAPLDDFDLDKLLATPNADEGFETLAYWRSALRGAEPCRVVAGSAGVTTLAFDRIAASADVENSTGQGRAAVHVFAVEVNDAHLSNALIDTGAQHTLLSRAAAAAAGIELGPESSAMVGFASFAARPAIVHKLRIGQLTLTDVPVLVADSPQLLRAGGQISLGIDVLHHLRCVLDYPARRLIVTDSGASITPELDVATGSTEPAWNIPLWTFSFAALAQGTLANGANARTLIDTGNRSGTFVSVAWANRNLANQNSTGQNSAGQSLAGQTLASNKASNATRPAGFQRRAIEQWRLGDRDLGPWPVLGSLPPALERLGIIDVLVGHDLLAGHRVEIDLANRRLRLSRSAAPPSQ